MNVSKADYVAFCTFAKTILPLQQLAADFGARSIIFFSLAKWGLLFLIYSDVWIHVKTILESDKVLSGERSFE